MLAKTCLSLLIAGGLLAPGLRAETHSISRTLPHPLAGHPGNIFLAGEEVAVAAPAHSAREWRLMDDEGATVAQGKLNEQGRAAFGKLPVGYYELLCAGEGRTNRVSLGVLEPLRARTPLTSPIAIDVAMAWFFPQKERMAAPASLCALAGVNRVRDRLTWVEVEPRRGEFATATRYDAAAQVQAEAGLQVLQVVHASPAWANPNTKHFPRDLRDVYRFYCEVARRWQGQVVAFEPWNEADISMFGGQTGSEIAALQKAAYLGLKAGNPKVIACQNVFAVHRPATLRDFEANETWPYFDTFNLHHYEPLENYPKLYADFRAVATGKPLWVTECSVPVKWHLEGQELTAEDARLQGERLTKTFALALQEGPAAVFYFMLPHYCEGETQFGILRADLTPRPGYLALAAAGRLLADAKALGHMALPDNAGQAYVFDARPDGKAAKVLVAWAQKETTLELPEAPRACFDHLGRAHPVPGKVLSVSRTPLYAVLGHGVRLPLTPPPPPAKALPGKPGPLVLQALLPEEDIVLNKSAYNWAAGQSKKVPVFLYNFGKKKAAGRLTASGPEGWKLSFPTTAEIAPGERKELELELTDGPPSATTKGTIRITGDFGSGGTPVLAVRFVPEGK
jgi:hypothetical protein